MWTYKFDRIDPTVNKDSSTVGRFTFNRYLYFEPDEYENWSKGNNLTSIPYSAELINNANIPEIGDHLTGSLSAFYVRDIISIQNLNTEENPQATSYAVVTLEYQNIPSQSQTNSDNSVYVSFNNIENEDQYGTIKPWEEPVGDFTVTPQQIQIPFERGLSGGVYVDIQTAAGQKIQGLQTDFWIQRASWTYNTNDPTEDYALSEPVINTSGMIIDNYFEIPAYRGLMLPPTRKTLYFNEKKNPETHTKKGTKFYQWSFEIIVNSKGFNVEVFNAGTQALSEPGILSSVFDICSWYVYDPTSEEPPQKNWGSLDQLLSARAEVMEYNKLIKNEKNKKVFQGDAIQNSIPLNFDGTIDYSALAGQTPKKTLSFGKYDTVEIFNFGWR